MKCRHVIVHPSFQLTNELAIVDRIRQTIPNHVFYASTFVSASVLQQVELDETDTQLDDIKRVHYNAIDSSPRLMTYAILPRWTDYSAHRSPTFVVKSFIHLLTSVDLLSRQSGILYHVPQIDPDTIVVVNDTPLLHQWAYSFRLPLDPSLVRFVLQSAYSCYQPLWFRPIELHLLSFLFHHQLDQLTTEHIDTVINDIQSHQQSYTMDTPNLIHTFANQSVASIVDIILPLIPTWFVLYLCHWFINQQPSKNAKPNAFATPQKHLLSILSTTTCMPNQRLHANQLVQQLHL